MPEPLALAAALGLFITLVVRLRRRANKALPSISNLRPGWAEVRGRVIAPSAGVRRAPISGREGLGWRVLVEQETGVRGWKTVVDRSEFADFELEDESGTISVRAAHSPTVLEIAEQRGRGGPFAPPPPSVERLIASHGNSRGVIFHKGIRWREWVLEDGREIRVRARVITEPSNESQGYRKLSEVLVLAGGTTHPIEFLDP